MLRVKEKHMKCPPSDLDLTLWMGSNGFNLSRYNSLEERLRLNHFKVIPQRIRMLHVPTHLSDDR